LVAIKSEEIKENRFVKVEKVSEAVKMKFLCPEDF
jgi:hypothetical protein